VTSFQTENLKERMLRKHIIKMVYSIKVDSETFLKMFNRETDLDLDDYEEIEKKYKDNDTFVVEEEKTGRFFTGKLERFQIEYPGFIEPVVDTSITLFRLVNISNITW